MEDGQVVVVVVVILTLTVWVEQASWTGGDDESGREDGIIWGSFFPSGCKTSGRAGRERERKN